MTFSHGTSLNLQRDITAERMSSAAIYTKAYLSKGGTYEVQFTASHTIVNLSLLQIFNDDTIQYCFFYFYFSLFLNFCIFNIIMIDHKYAIR